jgi:hypothetical protein
LAIVITTGITGTAAAGATMITGVVTMSGAMRAGIATITAGTADGINVTPMNAVTAKAGKTVTIVAEAGVTAMTDVDTVITIKLIKPGGASLPGFLIYEQTG